MLTAISFKSLRRCGGGNWACTRCWTSRPTARNDRKIRASGIDVLKFWRVNVKPVFELNISSLKRNGVQLYRFSHMTHGEYEDDKVAAKVVAKKPRNVNRSNEIWRRTKLKAGTHNARSFQFQSINWSCNTTITSFFRWYYQNRSAGQCHVIMGPNGGGKHLLLRSVLGLTPFLRRATAIRRQKSRASCALKA